MGAFSRLNRVFQANVNSLLNRAEDPELIINSTLDEMADGLKEARRDQVTALGTAKRLAEQAQTADDETRKWEDRAALAVRAGDDGLARDALRQKLIVEREATAKLAQADAAKRAVTELAAAIDRLEDRRVDLDAKKAALAAQVRAARTAESTTADASPSTNLDSLTNRIDAMEAEVEVAQVLEDPRRKDLDSRFAKLESEQQDQGVEDELSALKRRVEADD